MSTNGSLHPEIVRGSFWRGLYQKSGVHTFSILAIAMQWCSSLYDSMMFSGWNFGAYSSIGVQILVSWSHFHAIRTSLLTTAQPCNMLSSCTLHYLTSMSLKLSQLLRNRQLILSSRNNSYGAHTVNQVRSVPPTTSLILCPSQGRVE